MNPFARPPACATCSDTRTITKRVVARSGDLDHCPACGNLNDAEYDRFRRDAWARDNEPPRIVMAELTPEEFKTYEAMKADHPSASKATLLSWIEGQRYDPSKDEEFLAVAREEFKKWRARP